MANEFIIRKGYKSFSDSQITGSLSVTNAVTASFFTGSFRGDGSELTGIDGFPFTGSASISGSLVVVGPVTATEFIGNGSQLTGIDGFPFTGSAAISGSLIVDGNVIADSFTGSIQGTATSASYVNIANVNGFTAYSSSVNTAIGSVLDATTPLTATINNTNSPFTITSQSIVIVDSTNGNVTVNLPDLDAVVGTPNQKPILIYKNDYSQNVIFVSPSGSQLINGSAQDVIVSIQIGVVYNPTSGGYVTAGTSAQSLAELELFFVPKTETGSLSVATASYVEYTDVVNKPTLVSGSSQISFSGITNKPSLVSGSAQVSFTGIINKPSLVSGSSQVTYSGLTGKPSGIVSSSVQVKEYNVFATTGSNGFNGNQSITGSLTVTGQVVAQTLNVQQVTSSVVFSSGSNVFGNSLGNTQQFTGSVSITGSLNTSITAFGSAATTFLTSDSGTIRSRTSAQTLSDIAALPLAGGTLTGPLNGTSAVFSKSSNSGSGNDFPRLQVENTLATQGDGSSTFNFADLRIASGNNAVQLLIGTTFAAGVWAPAASINLASDHPLLFKTNNTTRLTIASTGAATFSSSVTTANEYYASGAGQNAFKINSVGSFYGMIQNIAADKWSLAYGVNGAGNTALGTSVLTWTGNGNVGIGTDTPVNRLHIATPTNADISIRLSDQDDNEAFGIVPVPNSGNGKLHFMARSGYNTAFNASTDAKITMQTNGNVGIGTATPGSLLDISGSDPTSLDAIRLRNTNSTSGGLTNLSFFNYVSAFGGTTGRAAEICSLATNTSNTGAASLLFKTTNDITTVVPIERMRITSGGYLKASNTGTYGNVNGSYHEIRSNGATNAIIISNTNALPYIANFSMSGTPNNDSIHFLYCEDSTAKRINLLSNGGIHNYQANNVNLSDERTKKDIEPLESYWEKFKAIEIVKFKYKDQTHDDFNIGVIAQQVEAVAPEFVDVDGWDTKPKLDEEGNEIVSEEGPLKSIYTADLYHATIKVLQEAMSKIEEQQSQIEILKAEIQTLKQ